MSAGRQHPAEIMIALQLASIQRAVTFRLRFHVVVAIPSIAVLPVSGPAQCRLAGKDQLDYPLRFIQASRRFAWCFVKAVGGTLLNRSVAEGPHSTRREGSAAVTLLLPRTC